MKSLAESSAQASHNRSQKRDLEHKMMEDSLLAVEKAHFSHFIYLCVISDNYSIILILIITIMMVRWPLTVNFWALLKLHATEVDRHGLTVSNEVPRRV